MTILTFVSEPIKATKTAIDNIGSGLFIPHYPLLQIVLLSDDFFKVVIIKSVIIINILLY